MAHMIAEVRTIRSVGIALIALAMVARYFAGAVTVALSNALWDRPIEYTVIDFAIQAVAQIGIPLGAVFVGVSIVIAKINSATALAPAGPVEARQTPQVERMDGAAGTA